MGENKGDGDKKIKREENTIARNTPYTLDEVLEVIMNDPENYGCEAMIADEPNHKENIDKDDPSDDKCLESISPTISTIPADIYFLLLDHLFGRVKTEYKIENNQINEQFPTKEEVIEIIDLTGPEEEMKIDEMAFVD